jgi:tRNA A37 threonylcarbamoyladenosine biosynthesis protein TsaE
MQKLDSRITACAASDTDAAVTALDAAVAANDIVFIKGSLGSGAWRVAAVLLQRLDAEQPTNRKGDYYAA